MNTFSFADLKNNSVVKNRNPEFNHVWEDYGLPDSSEQDMVNIDDYTDEDGVYQGRVYVSESDSVKYKSVTTMLGAIGDLRGENDWLEQWRKAVGEQEADRISAKACIRGTATHDMAEQYLLNKSVPSNHALGFSLFRALQPELDKIDNIICLEHALYSHKLRLAGRVDCVGEYEGSPAVIDFKTSRKIKTSADIGGYMRQVTLYQMMVHEMLGIKLEFGQILMGVDTMEDGKPGKLTFDVFFGNYRENVIDDLAMYWETVGKPLNINECKEFFI